MQQFPLAPGDRLAFVTDGMLERNAAHLDVAKTLNRTRHLHPRETVHELGAAVLNATGSDLRDDVTVLVRRPTTPTRQHPRSQPSRLSLIRPGRRSRLLQRACRPLTTAWTWTPCRSGPWPGAAHLAIG
ncbi:MAG: hypothetical protein QOH17_3210 [Pseudonocardiales bacterium]|nr:hypothetical protein [Pseudonocardiales bacterium]